jgi:AAA15 family ATPase/GTPase
VSCAFCRHLWSKCKRKKQFDPSPFFLQQFVLTSSTAYQEKQKIPLQPFRLNAKSQKEPSEFSIDFVCNKMLDSDQKVFFDLFLDESDGTQRLFSQAGGWLKALREGLVLFVDELDLHLHPNIVRYLIELFHSQKTNQKNAQLIFTTHDTSLLDSDLFRRDQVWFVQKDEQQGSLLYPLLDFKPRKGKAIEKRKSKEDGVKYDRIFCVFDRDNDLSARAFSLKKFDSPQTGFVKVCVPTIAFHP